MHPPTITATVVPRPSWCLTSSAAAYDNQPTLCVNVVCGGAGSGHHGGHCWQFYVTTCRQTLWVVVTCVLLGKLASGHAPSDHGGRLPSHRLGSHHADLVASLRPPIREIMAA